MKKLFNLLVVAAMAGTLVACGNKETEKTSVEPVTPKPQVEEYQPVHKSTTVDPRSSKRYAYFNAPQETAAVNVMINYDSTNTAAAPIHVTYGYANGDTYTYTIPAGFYLRCNESGRPRIIVDIYNTVWIQGQRKGDEFHEFVFYGDPQFNGVKIKPNSYRNQPAGEIKYLK